MENFDYLTGNQKYGMTRNLIAIFLFLNNRKVSNEAINNEIKKLLKEKAESIKHNIINKALFLKEFKGLYNKIFDRILDGVKNGSE